MICESRVINFNDYLTIEGDNDSVRKSACVQGRCKKKILYLSSNFAVNLKLFFLKKESLKKSIRQFICTLTNTVLTCSYLLMKKAISGEISNLIDEQQKRKLQDQRVNLLIFNR